MLQVPEAARQRDPVRGGGAEQWGRAHAAPAEGPAVRGAGQEEGGQEAGGGGQPQAGEDRLPHHDRVHGRHGADGPVRQPGLEGQPRVRAVR